MGRLERYERAKSRPEMTLLRAHNFEWVMSIFAEHLAAGPVELSALHERVDVELQQVRAIGWGDFQESGRSAREYCNDWVDRGWLNRALVDGVEQYSLTAASLDVLAFADRLVDRRSTVSESRLKQILDAVARLAGEADPDPQARIDRIDEQIAVLEDERAALLNGKVRPTPAAQLHEQLNGVMDLALHLPADFKRVADSVQSMHRRFAGEADDQVVGRGVTLQAFFADHDLLEASSEGRAFRGLMRLWGNHRAQASLRRDIDSLLRQDFAQELTPEQRRALRALPRMLVDSAEDVQETYRRLTQSLERFTQAQAEGDRDVRARLARAQAAAHALFGQGARRVSIDVQLGANLPDIQSVTQVHLADPRLRERPPVLETDSTGAGSSFTPEQVRELGGPAVEEIREAWARAVALSDHGRPTLHEVWSELGAAHRRPKNIVGLLHVAVSEGATFLDGTNEHLTAARVDGTHVTYTVPWAMFPATSAEPEPDLREALA